MSPLAFFFSPGVLIAMLVFYAVSMVLFLVDFVRDNRMANRVGVALLGVIWMLESAYMGTRIYANHALPVFSFDQATVMFAWLLITASVIVNYFYRIDFFTFFMNLLGFLVVAFDIVVHSGGGVSVPRQSELLILHIGIAFLSYIAFTLSFIFSVLYLLTDSALRFKRFQSGSFRRSAPVSRLDLFSFRFAVLGEPLLLIAIVLGFVWYMILKGQFLVWDAKPIVTLLLFCAYAVTLGLRVMGRVSGRKFAWLNVASFMIVLANFLVVGEFASQFHKW